MDNNNPKVQNIIAKDYWNERYKNGGNSGYGSYNEQLIKKLNWLKGLQIDSISDVGCGDFNFGSSLLYLYPNASYIGYDASDVVIEKNKKSFNYNFTHDKNLPLSDLTLCIDVLFHVLDEGDYADLLDRLEKYPKYLAVTGYEYNSNLNTHVKHRKFNYERFGQPVIRSIIEEDGELYFYLFKRGVDLTKVSCCLLTKEKEYPKQILDNIKQYNFGEILIGTQSDSPFNKYKLFNQAKFDTLYYQDDDAICPIKELVDQAKPDMINVAMKEGHIEAYKDEKMTMGLGWGSIFPKSVLSTLKKYTDIYGEDEVFKRETERILTSLNYPQNRLSLPIEDLPSAWAEDRLWRQPIHQEFKDIVKQRCDIIG